MKLRVLHVLSSLELGGAERLVHDLAVGVVGNSELEMAVLVINGRPDDGLLQGIIDAGVEVHCLERPRGSRSVGYVRRFLSLLLRLSPRILHSHNPGAKYWVILGRVFLPWIRTVHTVHDSRIVTRYSSIERHIHNLGISRTVAISNAVLRECDDSGIARSLCIVNGILLSNFRGSGRRNARRTSSLRVVSVARLQPEKKGQDVAIKAVALCRARGLPITCEFVGPAALGDLNTERDLKNLAKALAVDGLVKFSGRRDDVPAALNDADIFILPSRYEGFGLSLVEAMAAGLPVIASNLDGPAEILRDGHSGLLVAPGDPSALADAIEQLALDPDMRDRLAGEGVKTAMRFDIRRTVEAHARLYKAVAVRARRKG